MHCVSVPDPHPFLPVLTSRHPLFSFFIFPAAPFPLAPSLHKKTQVETCHKEKVRHAAGASLIPRLALHFNMRCAGGRALDLPSNKQKKCAHDAITAMLDNGTKQTHR
jgi:hypothetical protein